MFLCSIYFVVLFISIADQGFNIDRQRYVSRISYQILSTRCNIDPMTSLPILQIFLNIYCQYDTTYISDFRYHKPSSDTNTDTDPEILILAVDIINYGGNSKILTYRYS